MSLVLRSRHAFVLSLLALSMAGCASVKVSMPGLGNEDQLTDSTNYSERLALNEAAAALADQPWGEAPDSGVMSVLFGTIANNQNDRVLAEYVLDIRGFSADPVTAVIADADQSLAHARRVAEAGRQAVASITPVPTDISTLEAAISEARECRKMYVAALQHLADDGEGVSREDVTMIRDAFTQTIGDISLTADLVAERVAMGEGRARFAYPVAPATLENALE